MDHTSLTASNTPVGFTFTGLSGTVMPGTISGITPHDWVADANGLYHTTTDLKTVWEGLYKTMEAGNGVSLNAIQRLEGNAEAVFENTRLNKLDTATQARDREDLQRQFDAMAGALMKAGVDASHPLSVTSYLAMEHAMQSDPVLEELGVQGHGLNNPVAERYDGYTNDIQNVVDNKTYYVGAGLDHNEKAIADFMDDVVLGHSPFASVYINGHLTQLNQNGAAEDRIQAAVTAFNQAAFTKVYRASDFSETKAPTPTPAPAPHPVTPPVVTAPHPSPLLTAPAPAGYERAYDGSLIPTTLTVVTPHTWVADSTGLYHTTTDLQTEWRNLYTQMLAGHGGSLTAIQRMEGNAEAVFENTKLFSLDTATQARDREDIQRQLDAEAGAMAINARTLGIDPKMAFTRTSYLALERTLQFNTQLEELAMQGHGLNKPPASKYAGYTNDIQNHTDGKTRFVGGGVDQNENAVNALLDDVILGHTPFPTVFINGHEIQLNQNAAREDNIATAVAGLNESGFTRVFLAKDFRR